MEKGNVQHDLTCIKIERDIYKYMKTHLYTEHGKGTEGCLLDNAYL